MDTSYDSTWEEDEEEEDRKIVQVQGTCTKPQKGQPKGFRYEYMFSSAARDMQNYRHGYKRPGTNYQGDPGEMPNLSFYRNKIKFKPNGCYIDDLLTTWKEDYDTLERNHNYIQWLFPLRERGLNQYASPLQEKEIEMMKNDSTVLRRLLEAYKLMLGFYGLRLQNENTGDVCRAQNWKQRYQNLNNKTHNNLRITRILKCLGELGFQHCQYPLVRFFLKETLCHGELKNTKRSVLDYFMFSVKDKKERQDLVIFALKHYTPQSTFVWGPVDLLSNYQPALKKHKGDDGNIVMKEREKKETYEEVVDQYKTGQEKGWGDERTATKKRNSQDGIMEHRDEPLRNLNDDMKQYKNTDENTKTKTRNGQEGMMEHRRNSGDDMQGDKRDVSQDTKPRNGQDDIKEHRNEPLRNHNDDMKHKNTYEKTRNGQEGMTEHRRNSEDDMQEDKRDVREDTKPRNGQGGVKEHSKEPMRNHNDDMKQYKNTDENTRTKTRNGQEGMMEHRTEEISHRKNNEDDMQEDKGEVREDKPRNGHCGMKEHREAEISWGKKTEHDMKRNTMKAMEDNNLRNGQCGIKKHKKEELSKRNNDEDDIKEYKMEDQKYDRSRNGQDGMTECWEGETSQRKNEGKESKYKREKRGNKKPSNGQDGLKEPNEEMVGKKNNEDGMKERWEEEKDQRKNNEGDKSKYIRKEMGNKKPRNGQDGLEEPNEEMIRKMNNEDGMKEYKWKVWEEGNSQGGKKEPMKLKPPYNNQNQSETNGDDKQCRRENGEEGRNKLLEKNIQHGEKKDGGKETSDNTRPHTIHNKDNKMGDREEEKINDQNSCDVIKKNGKIDIPDDKCVTAQVVDVMPEDRKRTWCCFSSKRKLK